MPFRLSGGQSEALLQMLEPRLREQWRLPNLPNWLPILVFLSFASRLANNTWCQETPTISLSAIVVKVMRDVRFVLHNYHDWMFVCSVKVLKKINLDPKIKVFLFHSIIIAFCVKVLMLILLFEKKYVFVRIIHLKKCIRSVKARKRSHKNRGQFDGTQLVLLC